MTNSVGLSAQTSVFAEIVLFGFVDVITDIEFFVHKLDKLPFEFLKSSYYVVALTFVYGIAICLAISLPL